jgi:hypothetical protein
MLWQPPQLSSQDSGPGDGDVVHPGAAYIHCGEPMSPADPEPGNARRPVSTQPGPVDVLGVYLRTRVLRCRCGLQMEIPQ